MNTILLALPFLLLQLFKKQSFKQTTLILPSAFAIIPIFAFVPILPLYPIILLLSLLNTLHIRSFDHPLSIRALRLIKNLPSLKDSIHTQIPLPLLFLLFIICLLYPFTLTKPSIWTSLLLPLVFLCPTKLMPYPYHLLFLLRFRKKPKNESDLIEPENEIFYKTNPSFPLEKHTAGFSGKQTFSLPASDKPHVVVIYLESFRSSAIGKVTPCFDKLSKQGIYFSNFYANASQTFKAMFATLYGIPPCFGKDFSDSSSPVLTLPLRGLPNLFKEQGYKNLFIKAGSHNFENQGAFLKNHLFDEILDEREIKKANDQAYGTSWGVHDEFLYDYVIKKIASAKSPLFLHAASVTNHHPFFYPEDFKPKFGSTPFEKTMEYTDHALGQAIEKLQALKTPMHVYIMGDHGYPLHHSGKPCFSPCLDKHVTHVPLLILPLHCGDFTAKEIADVSSQIDLAPTMMDIYDFTGKNSFIGSSLLRKRENPSALLLNEAIKRVSGIVTKDTYETYDGYHPLYNTLSTLFKEKKISSESDDLKTLNFSSVAISHQDLQGLLDNNPYLESLYLDNSPLIASLDLSFPSTLKKISLDHNILLCDEDIHHLPRNIECLSITSLRNLTDLSLKHLSTYPIKEIALTCSNFSLNALTEFVKSIPLEKIWIHDGKMLDDEFFTALSQNELEEITMSGVKNLSDQSVKAISSPSLKLFMCDDCRNLSDLSLEYLKATKLEVLHLEKGHKLSDTGIGHITNLPIHTFFISHTEYITEEVMKKLHTPTMQNLFCVDCKCLPQVLKEGPGKQIYYLKEEANL